MDNISLLFDTDEKQYLKKKDSVKQDPTEDLFEILVHWIGEALYFNSYQDLFYWRREGKWESSNDSNPIIFVNSDSKTPIQPFIN